MKSLVQDSNTISICKTLKSIGRKIFLKNNMHVAINTTESYLATALQSYSNFLETLPILDKTKESRTINLLNPSCQHYIMNIPVNYCAKALFAVPYLHQDHPKLRVLAKLLSAKYLLPVVREQNGAYGAGAKISSDGIFSFYSYRDPHSTKTLDAFDKTYEWTRLENNRIDQQALFEAKLGVLQQLDSPIAPGNIGIDYFLYAVSQDMFVNYRSRMLSVTVDELYATVEKYFKKQPTNYGKCIMGPENKKLRLETCDKWKIIT